MSSPVFKVYDAQAEPSDCSRDPKRNLHVQASCALDAAILYVTWYPAKDLKQGIQIREFSLEVVECLPAGRNDYGQACHDRHNPGPEIEETRQIVRIRRQITIGVTLL